jgi:hypothetical protein
VASQQLCHLNVTQFTLQPVLTLVSLTLNPSLTCTRHRGALRCCSAPEALLLPPAGDRVRASKLCACGYRETFGLASSRRKSRLSPRARKWGPTCGIVRPSLRWRAGGGSKVPQRQRPLHSSQFPPGHACQSPEAAIAMLTLTQSWMVLLPARFCPPSSPQRQQACSQAPHSMPLCTLPQHPGLQSPGACDSARRGRASAHQGQSAQQAGRQALHCLGGEQSPHFKPSLGCPACRSAGHQMWGAPAKTA